MTTSSTLPSTSVPSRSTSSSPSPGVCVGVCKESPVSKLKLKILISLISLNFLSFFGSFFFQNGQLWHCKVPVWLPVKEPAFWLDEALRKTLWLMWEGLGLYALCCDWLDQETCLGTLIFISHTSVWKEPCCVVGGVKWTEGQGGGCGPESSAHYHL